MAHGFPKLSCLDGVLVPPDTRVLRCQMQSDTIRISYHSSVHIAARNQAVLPETLPKRSKKCKAYPYPYLILLA